MAKHAKKRKPAATRRRRRVGAMALNATSPLVIFGSIGAGFLLADRINPEIDKIIPPDKVDSKLVAGGQIGAGSAYIWLLKGKKNIALTVASGVMIGAGAKRAMAAFGLGNLAINGYQNVLSVSGYQSVPSVNGAMPRKNIAGYTPAGSGMGMNTVKAVINSAGLLDTQRRA